MLRRRIHRLIDLLKIVNITRTYQECIFFSRWCQAKSYFKMNLNIITPSKRINWLMIIFSVGAKIYDSSLPFYISLLSFADRSCWPGQVSIEKFSSFWFIYYFEISHRIDSFNFENFFHWIWFKLKFRFWWKS
jgi:hypothetical protein